MTWSIEREDWLRRLWNDGYSASECARKLGDGLTRNAIIGKVHRMKLPKRRPTVTKPHTGGWTEARRKAHRSLPAKKRANPTAIRIKAPPVEVFKPAPEDLAVGAWNPLPGTVPVELVDLTATSCRWPIGDGSPFLFCGCEAASGSSYCPTHKHLSVGAGSISEQGALRAASKVVKEERRTREWLEAA